MRSYRPHLWFKLSMIALVGGSAFPANAQDILKEFRNLRIGIAESEVKQLLGDAQERSPVRWVYRFSNETTENQLEVLWREGKVVSARIEFDPPLTEKPLAEAGAVFESLGPSQSPVDTVPTDWRLGQPALGQRWLVGLKGKVLSWSLDAPWKTSRKLVTYATALGALRNWGKSKKATLLQPIRSKTKPAKASEEGK